MKSPPLLHIHLARSIEPELIPCCRRYGIEIVIYNPLAGGLFSGKIKTGENIPTKGRYSDAHSSKLGTLYRKRYFKDATFEALRLIEPFAQKYELTLIEIALWWCVHHSKLQMQTQMQNGGGGGRGRDGVIIGVSSFEQLETNLRDLEKGPLPDEVVEGLDRAWLVTKATTAQYWHKELEYTYDMQEALFRPKA